MSGFSNPVQIVYDPQQSGCLWIVVVGANVSRRLVSTSSWECTPHRPESGLAISPKGDDSAVTGYGRKISSYT